MALVKPRSFEELYEEIRRLPESLTAEILEPGVIRTMSRPGQPHRSAEWRVRRSLGAFDADEGGAGWWFEIEAEARFGDRLAVPDLAGWRVREDMAFLDENPIEVVPDWICEILSPSTAGDDRTLKLPLHARHAVGWIWLVDPGARTVEVFESIGQRPTLAVIARGDDTVRLPPFDADIAVGRWWRPPPGTRAPKP